MTPMAEAIEGKIVILAYIKIVKLWCRHHNQTLKNKWQTRRKWLTVNIKDKVFLKLLQKNDKSIEK